MKRLADRIEDLFPRRIIAVDWSGDKSIHGQRTKIWVADWHHGNFTLTSGRTREETAEYLIAASREHTELVVGLDFAFSYPAWFVRQQGCATAPEFWELVANGKGEEWLYSSNAFCWGRKGIRCPEGHRAPDWMGFRQTDRELSIGGIHPKSPFQIGGAGAVGTGSLRGIPILHRLRTEGFSAWPFMTPRFPIALEIYPRFFTGKGTKSSREFRAARLSQASFSSLSKEVKGKAEDSEDAFDAVCSVVGMKGYAHEFARLAQETDPEIKLEGRIWGPASAIK